MAGLLIHRIGCCFALLALIGATAVLSYFVGFQDGKFTPREFVRGYTLLNPEPLRPQAWEADESDLVAPDFSRLTNIQYSDQSERNILDIYTPKNFAAPFATIVYIHGGGVSNSRKGESPVSWAIPLLRDGFAVAQIDYRPFYGSYGPHGTAASPFPAQIDDCKSALRFLRAHAADYRLDPNNIGVLGESFGGYLASLLGTTGQIISFGNALQHPEQSSAVYAVCSVSGMTDMRVYIKQADLHRLAIGYDWPELDTTGRFYTSPMNSNDRARSSPVFHVDPTDPPFFLIHGFDDPSVPPSQSDLLYTKLRNAGVHVEFKLIPGASHGGHVLNNINTRSNVVNFFKKHMVPYKH